MGSETTNRRRLRGMALSSRFSLLTVAILLVGTAVFIPWSLQQHETVMEKSVLAEARTLDKEMSAVWDYINGIQSIINYDEGGRFNFKDVYCSVAAKSIAKRFTASTDYQVRYVRDAPRLAEDVPDGFEAAALRAFEKENVNEYWGIDTVNGQKMFRFVSVLRYQGNCLECHGVPAGEKDITGFIKEGKEFGDIAGATSIFVPLAEYENAKQGEVVKDIAFFLLLTIALLVAVNVAFHRWVSQPLRELTSASERLGEGSWVEAEQALTVSAPGEIADLCDSFETMAARLREAQCSLESKVAERTAELSNANQSLESQQNSLNEANRALQEANDQLQEAIRFKSDFLSIMSHELKTPVTAIMASLGIWERERKKERRDEADANLLQDVSHSCRDLLSMVNNILDSAKMESGHLVVAPRTIDLVDLCEAVWTASVPYARSKSIDFDYEVGEDVPLFTCDPDILRRVLDNIVGNALKFTDNGGRVSLTASFDEKTPAVIVRVSDTGIGIAAEEQERIFDRFTQVNASLSRSYQGSGLGLSVAREMLAALGASISVESELGCGSVFTVVLPITALEEAEYDF